MESLREMIHHRSHIFDHHHCCSAATCPEYKQISAVVLITRSLSLTVPVVSCCGALPQPVQTPVQSMLDPVLRARRVLHLHPSASVERREIQLILIKTRHATPHSGIPWKYSLWIHWYVCNNIYMHTQTRFPLLLDGICYHTHFAWEQITRSVWKWV